MARAALIVLAIVVVLLALLWSVQRRLIYFPDAVAPPPAADVLPGARDVALETADGLRLTGWLVPPAPPDRRLAVLVTPGNAGNRRDRAPLAGALRGRGFTVLLLDYRGYGGNPGRPGETGLARDVQAAWRYLTGAAGFAPGQVILFGESLGAGVATGLAAGGTLAGAEPAGLVLRSPFVSLAAVGREHYPLLPAGLLLRDRYPVAEQIAGVTVPTVVIYGTGDSIVPAKQSRAVAERAGNLVGAIAVDGADHNDAALVDGPAVVDAVVTIAEHRAG